MLFKKHFLSQDFFEDDELDNYNRKPLQKGEIDSDIESVSTSRDSLVKKFYIKHRHTEIAHISLKNSRLGVSYIKDHPLTVEEYQVLIDRAVGVINRYSAHYNGVGYLMTTLDGSDYLYALEELSER